MADLVPPVGVLARLGGGPFADALPQVEVGDATFLNAREFRYAGFFNRLKQAVAGHWRPNDELRRRDPTGQVYGIAGRTTVLAVSLDADGALRQAAVAEPSGVPFLDAAAVAAFRGAEPFLHPPRGLLEADGQVHFTFTFRLDFDGRGAGLP